MANIKDELRTLGALRKQAEAERTVVMKDTRKAIFKAQDKGLGVTAIAGLLDLTRATVYTILSQGETP